MVFRYDELGGGVGGSGSYYGGGSNYNNYPGGSGYYDGRPPYFDGVGGRPYPYPDECRCANNAFCRSKFILCTVKSTVLTSKKATEQKIHT